METTTTETKENTTLCNCSVLQNRRIQTSLSLVLLFLSAFLFAETIKSLKEYRYVGGGIAPTNAITVTGEGEVFAIPDTAEFTFSIQEEAPTTAEAQNVATEKANDVIKTLVEQGVEEKDIKTTSYNLTPKYEWRDATPCLRFPCEKTREQVGFELSQSVQVKVRDIDRAGELLEIVASKEISSVSGLSFTIADEDSLKVEARKQAIDEAKEKGEKLAQDLGVSLVRIVGFSEGSGYYPAMYARSEMMLDSSAPLGLGGPEVSMAPAVPAGENRVVSNVSVTYEIK